MSRTHPRIVQEWAFDKAAQAYLRSLPPEHFMEATTQATQRKITLESLDLVHARRPEVHVFNELLVQYYHGRAEQIRQVVPDNMVVVSQEPPRAQTSFNVPLEAVAPLWVLEYVSRSSERKDYEDSFRKYERDLKVPYYLIFRPEEEDLTLFHHNGRRYVSVRPNEHERYAIPELEIEVALVDGWVRYWFRGELLPLPADLQRDLEETRQLLAVARRQARKEKRRADVLEIRAAEEARHAQQQQHLAEEQQRRADEQQRRADEQQQRADGERRAREALEEELARLRAEQSGQPPNHRS